MAHHSIRSGLGVFILVAMWVVSVRAEEPLLPLAPMPEEGIMLPAEPIPSDPQNDTPMFVYLVDPVSSDADTVVVFDL